ncbi:MAG: glutathione S-transferase N-terminal domain-containing protein [Aliidiomarina sp.]|uniref:glutathione S-transferase family protein n=1 Tax=Aliidiomarina sp. TaxID=1872439 RepID=UPI0025BD7953|nr:glutathione S-transferase N-terminal domain-containing protein [Aliidiomarina sp.]MCH8502593.1 glutathione S-transferase N-terminal domain-containing protein [Aliidiomarina sp.]
MMQLFGSFTSPFVRHIRVALADTGLAHEFIETDYSQSAAGSPAQRVPFLRTDVGGKTLQLNDSTSILKLIRESAGESFCADVESLDLYCLINTALDTTVNLFLLEREGLTSDANPYLQRQAARIQTSLLALEDYPWPAQLPWDDAGIRLACFMDWALFRQRLDFSNYPTLLKLLNDAKAQPSFVATAPPQA